MSSAFCLLALCWFTALIINLTKLNFMQVVSRIPMKEQNVAIIATQLWKLRSRNDISFLAYYFHSFGWCFIKDSTLKWLNETLRNWVHEEDGYQISPSWFIYSRSFSFDWQYFVLNCCVFYLGCCVACRFHAQLWMYPSSDHELDLMHRTWLCTWSRHCWWKGWKSEIMWK